MSASWTGELVWYERADEVSLVVYVAPKVYASFEEDRRMATVSNVSVPVTQSLPNTSRVIHRQPITLTQHAGKLYAGPIYAILAGSRGSSFVGARANFRDLMRVARASKRFIYVVPANHVTSDTEWIGYVRTGSRQWIQVPCPRPEAIYNRIPNRNLEHNEYAVQAKAVIESLAIPMFNPGYFDKSIIYGIIRAANLGRYLPETLDGLTKTGLRHLLRRHEAVYLKPTDGSIGHGMIRVERADGEYAVKVLKHSRCTSILAKTNQQLWHVLSKHRLPGRYVLQSAVRNVEWHGRSCDFRVLLQKQDDEWHVVGKGVRVAGPNTITTHVPNGGSIADCAAVLMEKFGEHSDSVDVAINVMTLRCAQAIDRYYGHQLGEMSMDVGVDEAGSPWFFEANAKPMKFDEPSIRSASLKGVLAHLDELRSINPTTKMKKRRVRVPRRKL